jgi:hypothetical protein
MWLAIALLLVMPLIAMQFTNAVAWSVGDFIIAATLLICAGTLYEILSPKARNPAHRTVIAGVILMAVLLIWAEGAVGIFH